MPWLGDWLRQASRRRGVDLVVRAIGQQRPDSVDPVQRRIDDLFAERSDTPKATFPHGVDDCVEQLRWLVALLRWADEVADDLGP